MTPVQRYYINQAKAVKDSLGRIIDRLNPAHTPIWLQKELRSSYHTAQCIQAGRERDAK